MLYEEIKNGDFTNFNMLNENQQIEIMKNWNQKQWIKFRMQNTVSEEEVFEPIIKLMEDDEIRPNI